MKKSLFPLLFLILITFHSCKKTEFNDYLINDIDYEFSGINDCLINDGGNNGSSLDITLFIDNPDYTDIYGIKTSYVGSNKDKSLQISRIINLSFQNDRISLYRCLRFVSSSSGTYTLSVITMDGLESKPYSFKINRPTGAN